jgi:hypothetical protein
MLVLADGPLAVRDVRTLAPRVAVLNTPGCGLALRGFVSLRALGVNRVGFLHGVGDEQHDVERFHQRPAVLA